MPVSDPFREGIARGWKTIDGSRLEQDLTLEADVAIIDQFGNEHWLKGLEFPYT